MTSTTLSVKTIEDIIWYFSINETIASAAQKSKVSKNTAYFYYNLLLERLELIGYYKSNKIYDDIFRYSYTDMIWNMKWCTCVFMRNHRGLSSQRSLQYEKKYATQYFYFFLCQDTLKQKNGSMIFEKIMYKDILRLIKITGPLNSIPTNLKKSDKYITQTMVRRVPRKIVKEFTLYQARCLDSLSPVLDYFEYKERQSPYRNAENFGIKRKEARKFRLTTLRMKSSLEPQPRVETHSDPVAYESGKA